MSSWSIVETQPFCFANNQPYFLLFIKTFNQPIGCFFCKIRTMTRHFENHQNQLYLQFLFSKKRLSLELK